MNRAEATKVAMLAKFGDAKRGAKAALHFHDAEGAWYSDPAHAARAFGVIRGFEDNSFRPGEAISEGHAEKLAEQTAKAPTSPLSPEQQAARLFPGLKERAIAAGPGAPGAERSSPTASPRSLISWSAARPTC